MLMHSLDHTLIGYQFAFYGSFLCILICKADESILILRRTLGFSLFFSSLFVLPSFLLFLFLLLHR